MRTAIALVSLLGTVSLALAGPPVAPLPSLSPPSASPTAAPPVPTVPTAGPAASPSAPPAPENSKPSVTVQGTPEQDALEKHFLAEGYKMEMRNGEKVFCRREEQLGSHLGGAKMCGTTHELALREAEAQQTVNRATMQQNNPSGR